jgi:ureidoglycolate amidohydrolase
VLSATKQLGLSHKQMVSRAYHDSLFMAQIAPAGMIFRNGWSHRPDEFSSAADIENGVKTLALTLAELAGSAGPDKTEL